MQRLNVIAVIVFAAAAAIGLVANSSGSGSSLAQFNETDATHIVGSESETWQTRIFTRSGHFAGSGVTACVPTSVADSLQECNSTYLLPDGRLVAQGLVSSRTAYNLVVVGGSGRYLGARGTLITVQYGTNPRRAHLTLLLR